MAIDLVSSDAGIKLGRTRRGQAEGSKATRFAKGHDPRRNLKGRPRTFDEARALAQAILHRELVTKDGRKISVAEAILTSWANSKEHQKNLLELAFGKVPDKIEGPISQQTLILRFGHERTNPNGPHPRLPAELSPGAN